jgi:selenide,water dikinase
MDYKLTQYSKASGCGCKIAPAVLEEILKGTGQTMSFSQLLVGNETRDDAAVFELHNGDCIISTTDFFTPIVDDAFDFGKISACNAISDVYAMGGKPLMAVAILGWPVDKIPAEVAKEVIKGAQEICSAAGIPLAGGHSVDTQDPLFGLAVTGHIRKEHLKKNNTIKENDILYLTKPLGTGILSAALKRGLLKAEDYSLLLNTASTLNSIGEKAGQQSYVHAMTDVTGFGFAGHLLEMLEGNNLSAIIEKEKIPVMNSVKEYMSQFVFPDNTTRNFNAQSARTEGMVDLDFMLYCDPQTSGGLLISVDKNHEADMDDLLKSNNQFFSKIGQITSRKEKEIVFV